MEGLNCWEYYLCGREVGGINSEELGTCPASTLYHNSGINGGTFSGRYCWTVEGTLCDSEIQGGLEDKLLNCINCSFFKSVNVEQGREFILMPQKIHQNK
ncbi:hypothetical protein GQR60_07870 [Labilibaculum sp. A4]|uniref:two-CW domain-containing protein n=1 Tax=Labilibaculum euxinus TaxID=2686357 RepID=UPI000F621099|nr:hypothetical protein [Labilibaculum euxinus]MDQ1769695.1 hypothetical protein [Labilibaculum euxinus]MWN76252.1 hypothetical protein [Labilibaculum euxinus]